MAKDDSLIGSFASRFAAKEKERKAKQAEIQRRAGKATRAAVSDVKDLGRGAAKLPVTAYEYLRKSKPMDVARDVGRFAVGIGEDIAADPAGFVAEELAAPFVAARDFAVTREKAAEARAAGDTETADKLEQFAALAVVGGVPIVGKGAKKAVKAGTKKAVKGAKKAEGKAVRGIVQTPDLREMNTEEAIRVARSAPHLIQDKSGQYVGAPRGITTEKQIKEMRKNFDADVATGAVGGDWYVRAREANKEWAGEDPARQRLLAREEALWSAQANPDTNLNFALQGHNAYEMGAPLSKVRTGAQARTYQAARDAGVDIPLGKKTGIYGQHLDPTVPFATTGTNDIWHARGFGYTNKDGDIFSRALTPQEHRFLDYETMLAVDRANAAKLGGRTDWTAHEIQAAPWVAGKGRALSKSRNMSLEEGMAEASKTYPDFGDKYTAFGTHEQTPYIHADHLSDVARGTEELRAKYALDPRSSWTDEAGRDAIYDALGFYQRPTLSASGIYEAPGGPLEINPAKVARPLVGMTQGAVDEASRSGLSMAEAVRAYIDAQGAGAWHKPIFNAKPGEMGSVFVPLEGKIGANTISELRAIGEKYGLGDIIDTGQGVTFTNFGGAPSGKATGKALKEGLTKELRDVLGDVTPRRAKIDSDYLSMFETGTTPGSGEVTRNLQQMLEKYGEVPNAKISESEAIRRKAAANMARDAEFGGARPDIQRAREIISKEGTKGLFEALKRGEALPAIAAGSLLSLYGLSGGEDEETY